MRKRLGLICVVLMSIPAVALSQQAQTGPNPQTLIEKAIQLSNSQKVLPRYTYFLLELTQNRTPKGKLLLNDSTLYEYTWIGDLPYGRVVEKQGKPLKGQALADEQARYEKALADHAGLTMNTRLKGTRATLVDPALELEPLVTAAYTVREVRQETLTGSPTHVIDCTPVASSDPAHPAATRHVVLWITDGGVILRHTYDVVSDESDKLRGSHGQEDFQLIDGNRLPQHRTFHLNAPNGNTGDFESTYSRYRRFNVSSRILPADGPADDNPDTNSPTH